MLNSDEYITLSFCLSREAVELVLELWDLGLVITNPSPAHYLSLLSIYRYIKGALWGSAEV